MGRDPRNQSGRREVHAIRPVFSEARLMGRVERATGIEPV